MNKNIYRLNELPSVSKLRNDDTKNAPGPGVQRDNLYSFFRCSALSSLCSLCYTFEEIIMVQDANESVLQQSIPTLLKKYSYQQPQDQQVNIINYKTKEGYISIVLSV
jgi:hypothetical protein